MKAQKAESWGVGQHVIKLKKHSAEVGDVRLAAAILKSERNKENVWTHGPTPAPTAALPIALYFVRKLRPS